VALHRRDGVAELVFLRDALDAELGLALLVGVAGARVAAGSPPGSARQGAQPDRLVARQQRPGDLGSVDRPVGWQVEVESGPVEQQAQAIEEGALAGVHGDGHRQLALLPGRGRLGPDQRLTVGKLDRAVERGCRRDEFDRREEGVDSRDGVGVGMQGVARHVLGGPVEELLEAVAARDTGRIEDLCFSLAGTARRLRRADYLVERGRRE
jgi:hypothetical protein